VVYIFYLFKLVFMIENSLTDRQLIEALLSMSGNQTVAAKLLGVSQQAVAGMMEKNVISKEGTYGDWFPALFTHYREVAAGRGGEDLQKELTRVRIESERETALEKKMNRLVKQNDLILKKELLSTLLNFSAGIQFQVDSIGEKVIEAIESKHDIKLDDELVNTHIRSALRSIASSAGELVGDLEGGSDVAVAD